MKSREYVYVGEPIPELTTQEHKEFLILLEKAVLHSLEKRNLISRHQRDRCLVGIDDLHTKEHRKHQP